MVKARILIIDDEKDIRESLSDILKDEGYDVLTANDAISARKIKNNSILDAILLDIWMPDCDGISLLKEWAKNKEINCPVIMMSGHGTIDTAIEATKIGAFDFLEKPISLQKLLKTVSLALKKTLTVNKIDSTFISDNENLIIKNFRKQLTELKKEYLICISGTDGNFMNLCVEFLVGNNFYSFDPLQKLDLSVIRRIQGKGKGTLLIRYFNDLANYDISETKNLIKEIISNKIKVIIIDNRKKFLNKLLENDWDLNKQTLSIPIDNDMDLISEYSKIILDYYLSKNTNLGYKAFDTSALNVMRSNRNFMNLDKLDEFIINLIRQTDSETISSNDINLQNIEIDNRHESNEDEILDNFHILFERDFREARVEFEKKYFEYHIQSNISVSDLSKKTGLERTHLYRKLKQLKINIK